MICMAESSRIQFSLRSILVLVVLVALGCVLAPIWLIDFPFTATSCAIFPIAVSIIAMLALCTGAVCGYPARFMLGRTACRLLGWTVFSLIVVATGYLAWVFSRESHVTAIWEDPLYPRPFPYADEVLERYSHWLDARNPAPLGTIKIHGEYYTILEHLKWSIIAGIASMFFVLGFLAPNFMAHFQLRLRRALSWFSPNDQN